MLECLEVLKSNRGVGGIFLPFSPELKQFTKSSRNSWLILFVRKPRFSQDLSFRLNIWPSLLPANISLCAYYELQPLCSGANNSSLEFLFVK